MGLHIEFGEPGVEEYLKEVMDWNERYIEMAALANEFEQQNHTLLAALKAAPLIDWLDEIEGGARVIDLIEYDDWYHDQRQAAIAAVEGE